MYDSNYCNYFCRLKKYEEDQLKVVLEALGLEKLFVPVFKKHRISYLDYLRLSDRDFIEIGVVDPAERKTLCQNILQTKPTQSVESYILTETPLRIQRHLT